MGQIEVRNRHISVNQLLGQITLFAWRLLPFQ